MIIAIRLMLFFTLTLGVLYPLVCTGLANLAFPRQAQGDSSLVGKFFDQKDLFWGRPSATADKPYNAASSGGSNLGPQDPKWLAQQKAVMDQPEDLRTASGSGLDPHITPEAAYFQVARVAKARRLKEEDVRRLVDSCVEGPTLGFLGHSRVNVAALNLKVQGLR